MSGLRHRKRSHKVRYYGGSSSQNNYSLVILLSFIVLFETILLLFLIPKTPPRRPAQLISQKKARTETKVPVKKSTEPRKIKIKETLVPPVIQKIVPKETRAKIAIVVDDWGYNASDLEIIKGIKFPLTLAILPFHAYSHKIAQFAHENNYEVIVHMPMEPDDKDSVDLEPKTLMVDMDSDIINDLLNEALADIPYAKGINNHMGSLATQDKKFVTTVFKELKKNNLYFLDSFVVPDSVCYDVSRQMGVKFAKRSTFLDNDLSYAYIRDQIMELVKEADESGYAIGVGHDRDNTLEVLKEVMPQLAKEGYKFVFVSELVE